MILLCPFHMFRAIHAQNKIMGKFTMIRTISQERSQLRLELEKQISW